MLIDAKAKLIAVLDDQTELLPLVVQPAEDRAAKNGPGQFDGARDRRILLQR